MWSMARLLQRKARHILWISGRDRGSFPGRNIVICIRGAIYRALSVFRDNHFISCLPLKNHLGICEKIGFLSPALNVRQLRGERGGTVAGVPWSRDFDKSLKGFL